MPFRPPATLSPTSSQQVAALGVGVAPPAPGSGSVSINGVLDMLSHVVVGVYDLYFDEIYAQGITAQDGANFGIFVSNTANPSFRINDYNWGDFISLSSAGVLSLGSSGRQWITAAGTIVLGGPVGTPTQVDNNGNIQQYGHLTTISPGVSSPAVTSGVAFTPSVAGDTRVYFQINAAVAGSYTLTMGPTSGAENTIASGVAMLVGSDVVTSLWVPATWKVVLTLTSVTLARTTVVGV